jgi:hypothetical protein
MRSRKTVSGGLLESNRVKGFARSVGALQIPGDMLIFSSSGNTSGTAVAAAITTWLSLPRITHCHSPGFTCFLHRPNWRVDWGCGGNYHHCISHVLYDNTHLYSPSRTLALLLIYDFSRLRQSNCFHLTSYIIIVLIPQVRKSM